MDDPLYQQSRAGFAFAVYRNRIESRVGAYVPHPEIILLRSVVSVDVKRFTGTLVVHTNDGREHKYLIGGEWAEAQAAILRALDMDG